MKIEQLNSSFTKNVITLITGTGVAQLIPIIATPFLTRFYTPSEFGIFAIFIAVSSILAVIATGRYELAIIVPKSDGVAFILLLLAITLTSFFSLALLAVFYAFEATLRHWLISEVIFLVPLGVVLIGSYQSLNYWFNRKAKYNQMAVSRISQSVSGSSAQLLFGMLSTGSLGLIVGQLVGQVISLCYLSKKVFNLGPKALDKKKCLFKIYCVAKKFADFPKFLIAAHCFNTASAQAPLLLINFFFTSTASGLFMLTQRVLMAPVGLIASAIGDVFRQEASLKYAIDKECKLIYLTTLKKLIVIGAVPFTVLFFFAEELFAIVFGEEWAEAGYYAKILTPMFFMQFIASPLSSMFIISEEQKIDLWWQIGLFILVIMSFAIWGANGELESAIVFFSLTYVLMYIVNLFLSYKFACGWKYVAKEFLK